MVQNYLVSSTVLQELKENLWFIKCKKHSPTVNFVWMQMQVVKNFIGHLDSKCEHTGCDIKELAMRR